MSPLGDKSDFVLKGAKEDQGTYCRVVSVGKDVNWEKANRRRVNGLLVGPLASDQPQRY